MRLQQVAIHNVASAEQHADILTNPLGCEAIWRHPDFLMNLSLGIFLCSLDLLSVRIFLFMLGEGVPSRHVLACVRGS